MKILIKYFLINQEDGTQPACLRVTKEVAKQRWKREEALIKTLDKVKVRFEILKGRFEACKNHELSPWEIEGWLEEMEMILEKGLE